MARLPYVDDPAGPDVAAAYAEVRALGRPLLNLYRILGNQPAALRAFLGSTRASAYANVRTVLATARSACAASIA